MTVEYKRGDVYWVKFPKPHYNPSDSNDRHGMPKPHTVIHGWHMAILLTDHDAPGLSDKHVVVVPISKAQAAAQNNQLVATHIPLEVADHPFLEDKSYALVFQPITIPKHWILQDEYAGKIKPEVMRTISSALILTTGSSEDVQRLIDQAVERTLQEILLDSKLKIDDASSDK